MDTAGPGRVMRCSIAKGERTLTQRRTVATGDEVTREATAIDAGAPKPAPRRRARMSDVAAAAGVSTTTVSLVLSGKAGSSIPDVTKERVIEASRTLGYRTNTVARNLRQQSSDTIGLISDTIASTPFAGAMIHGADQAAAAAGQSFNLFRASPRRKYQSP